jgi:UDP-N-acetylglucosamine--N-acetylmuramyl-(pentapeptide) pyrophosphoryl-undecaprenol N-acetylglucosamine transferase
MSKPLLILTGGGTAGHVIPHFALLPSLRQAGWDCEYIGSQGMERGLVMQQGIRFHQIASGKLRRYFSWQNVLDLFRIAWGFLQALWILSRRKPRVVFSKGGFVSVPVCYAAALLRIPVITHESDLTPGLATRLITPIARVCLCTFPETQRHLTRAVLVGSPVRQELLAGDRSRGLAMCGFDRQDPRPVVLFMGGSLGAQKINLCLEQTFAALKQRYRVIHITGKSKSLGLVDEDYKGFEYVGSELADVYAATDFVVARAGANSIFEFLALHKPMLLIPLKAGSRGDQIVNAQSFVNKGWAQVMDEDQLSPDRLAAAIDQLARSAPSMLEAQSHFQHQQTFAKIIEVLSPFRGL